MKKPFYSCLVIAMCLAAPVSLAAQSSPSSPVSMDELKEIIQFDYTLKDLSRLVEQGVEIPQDRYYLLDGTITGVTVFDPNPDTFYAEAELITAEWQGLEAIRSYKVILVFTDPTFAERVLQRTPREPTSEDITNSTDGIVIARFNSLFELSDTISLPVFIVDHFKTLRRR